MNVMLKTNRFGLIKFLLPFYCVLTFLFVMLVASYIIDYEAMKSQTFACVTLSALEGGFIIALLCLKFAGIKTYEFTPEQIIVYRNKKQIIRIDVDTLVCMKYNRFRFRCILYMAGGGFLAVGCWKLYLFLSNGSRVTLGIFQPKDIEKLRELYGELVQINDPIND